MGKFGWDLPPGCTNSDIERAAGWGATCDCCKQDADDCICDECTTCGEAGNPSCYKPAPHGHGMFYNKRQRIAQSMVTIAELQERVVHEQQHLERLKALPDDWIDD